MDHGLLPLKWSDSLATAAEVHARRLAQEPDLSHRYVGESDLAERAAQAGVHFQAVAENIAVGDSGIKIQEGWMRSIHHRANILDPQMDTIGIAIIEGVGNLYVVADFARLSEEPSSDRIREKWAIYSTPRESTRLAHAKTRSSPAGWSAVYPKGSPPDQSSASKQAISRAFRTKCSGN